MKKAAKIALGVLLWVAIVGGAVYAIHYFNGGF